MAGRLVWPLTHGEVPAQQLCPLHYLTTSIPAQHWMASSHGLWTPTEPFWSRDSQWIHGKDEDSNQRRKVHNLQSTGRHKKYHKWPLTNLWLVGLIFKRLKKAKFRQAAKMLLSLRSNPQTMSSYIQDCDSLCTRTDHHMLLSIVLHMVVPLYLK